MALFGLAPYRCRACRNRFFRIPIGNGNGHTAAADDFHPTEPARPLPVEPAAVELAISRPAGEHPLAQIPIAFSILIVSRDPAVRKLLCKVLARPGYHTHPLGEDSDLASELQSRKVDLLITDLEIPEQQGLETVEALRSQYPKLKIIALTALRVSGEPGSIVLPKPFRRELLLESVQNALAQAADTRPSVR
jgi:CheY-like chemotaxis protein